MSSVMPTMNPAYFAVEQIGAIQRTFMKSNGISKESVDNRVLVLKKEHYQDPDSYNMPSLSHLKYLLRAICRLAANQDKDDYVECAQETRRPKVHFDEKTKNIFLTMRTCRKIMCDLMECSHNQANEHFLFSIQMIFLAWESSFYYNVVRYTMMLQVENWAMKGGYRYSEIISTCLEYDEILKVIEVYGINFIGLDSQLDLYLKNFICKYFGISHVELKAHYAKVVDYIATSHHFTPVLNNTTSNKRMPYAIKLTSAGSSMPDLVSDVVRPPHNQHVPRAQQIPMGWSPLPTRLNVSPHIMHRPPFFSGTPQRFTQMPPFPINLPLRVATTICEQPTMPSAIPTPYLPRNREEEPQEQVQQVRPPKALVPKSCLQILQLYQNLCPMYCPWKF
ncbi:uncharacterized protein LOC109606125 [Aethina tumida]|uniref:uncharacterized protein LOC109606125 n=1 Tax=Aethina tumida TaxID=116153 RepID=UPI002147CE2F|nr:uncharacterized protein LOC109606125 [Aethina tumida]XP_049822213.1 uncharacterized protein LOC109606125 [Aethina tumida]